MYLATDVAVHKQAACCSLRRVAGPPRGGDQSVIGNARKISNYGMETHRPIAEEYRRLTCRAIGHPENQQLETEDSEEIIEAPSRIQV